MLAASLPNPSSPDFPAVVAMAFGFAWTAGAFWHEMSRDDVQSAGFCGAFFGAGFGLFIYGLSLVIDLY